MQYTHIPASIRNAHGVWLSEMSVFVFIWYNFCIFFSSTWNDVKFGHNIRLNAMCPTQRELKDSLSLVVDHFRSPIIIMFFFRRWRLVARHRLCRITDAEARIPNSEYAVDTRNTRPPFPWFPIHLLNFSSHATPILTLFPHILAKNNIIQPNIYIYI